MISASSASTPKSSIISSNLMWLIIVSVFLLTIYFMRYLQVLSMRQFMLQSKEISYIFNATSSSKITNNRNLIQTTQVRILLPLEAVVNPGDTLEVIGSVDSKLRPLNSERITLISRTVRTIKRHVSYGFPSLYDLLKLLEEVSLGLKARLSGYLEPSQASLLAGMVFGGVENQPRSLLEAMKNTGLTHITSASGFNVSILIGFSLSLFTRVVNRRMAIIACLITIISYSVMAGLTPPIIRASLMGVLYLFSTLSGKPYSVLRSLGLSVVLMLIYQPFLIYSISFLLTVTSTLGIVFSGKVFKPGSQGSGILATTIGVLEENLKVTLSVILFTAPLLLYSFGTFSLVAPLANALLLWMVPMLTLGGMGFMVATLLPGIVPRVLSVPLAILLEVFERSVRLFSDLPFSNLYFSKPAIWGIFLWYVCLFIYLKRRVAVNSNDC